jgi:hypothetical protein
MTLNVFIFYNFDSFTIVLQLEFNKQLVKKRMFEKQIVHFCLLIILNSLEMFYSTLGWHLSQTSSFYTYVIEHLGKV